jgi:predicted house-cleaning NTP pyrophosphatase (Maf/HAM1 superfamily)
MIRIIILFYCLVNATLLNSQANVVVKEEDKVAMLMDLYLQINKSITHINGYRITIITTTDRRSMEQTRASFQQQFSFKTKWEYIEPYYHLKAGAFTSRAEAGVMLESIKKKFSTAFLSRDKISYDEF